MSILLHGDCLEEMKGIEDNSIDLIFCDLPYGETNCKWDSCIDLDKFWIEVMRIKKLNTPIFFTTTTKFGVSLIQSAPKKCFFRYDLIWVKSSGSGFLNSKRAPLRKHESIYVFYEKLPFYDLSSHTHKFIKNTVNTQISKQKDKDLYGETKGGTIGAVHGSNYEPLLPTSILEIKSTRGKHSTEKPVALIEWVLKYYSKEGDTVLDPTMGSGSTGVACKNMNRNFIGIEKDPEIYEVAVNRIEN
jgi:DNA modification methylase